MFRTGRREDEKGRTHLIRALLQVARLRKKARQKNTGMKHAAKSCRSAGQYGISLRVDALKPGREEGFQSRLSAHDDGEGQKGRTEHDALDHER